MYPFHIYVDGSIIFEMIDRLRKWSELERRRANLSGSTFGPSSEPNESANWPIGL